ncbi:MAG TPA: TlpA disulfide reductase family protein [Azospirillaceae bacterium]|nr:TlpA disulfide reductase family protein [Azospirillaceae bacterium]
MKRTVLALAAALLLHAGPAAAGEAKPFVPGSWAEIRDAHAGKPLAVHLWSITCGPCLVELPAWNRFRRDHPGVAVVLVSTDRPEDAARARQVLTKAGLDDAESWTFADPFAARLRHELDPGWRGELPRTLLLAPDGTRTVVQGADIAAVERWADGQLPGR